MKYLFVLLFFVLELSILNAQHWKELSQASMKLKYEIPQGWYVGGFISGDACNCTGATINASKDQRIKMVIFSSDHTDIDSLKDQKIWGYSFAPSSMNPEILKTDFFNYEKALSTWNEDTKATVLRFATSSEDFQYLVYFWGNLEDVSNNATVIEHILHSIQKT